MKYKEKKLSTLDSLHSLVLTRSEHTESVKMDMLMLIHEIKQKINQEIYDEQKERKAIYTVPRKPLP